MARDSSHVRASSTPRKHALLDYHRCSETLRKLCDKQGATRLPYDLSCDGVMCTKCESGKIRRRMTYDGPPKDIGYWQWRVSTVPFS